MSLILLFPALLFAVCGGQMMTAATGIAIRSKSSVWETARPEAGGALLLYALALICAATAGGWL